MTYLSPIVSFEIDGRHVISKGDYEKAGYPRKMSGSKIAGILGKSRFGTPFTTACALMGICRENISSKHSVQAGNALERKIVEYAKVKYAEYGDFVHADEIFPNGHNEDYDSRTPDWDDDYFSGNIDGLVYESDDHTFDKSAILEVKTTSNIDDWANGVPEYYEVQVQLYNHFISKSDHAYVVMAYLTREEQADPTLWTPSIENVFLYRIEIDTEKVAEMLSQLMDWYDEYIMNNITPDASTYSNGDMDMLDHLKSISSNKSSIQDMIDRYEELTAMIKENEASMSEITSEMNDLKAKIKDYMVVNKSDAMETTSKRYRVSISHRETKTVNRYKLIADGIDPTKYEDVKVSDIFDFKLNKEEKEKKKKGE